MGRHLAQGMSDMRKGDIYQSEDGAIFYRTHDDRLQYIQPFGHTWQIYSGFGLFPARRVIRQSRAELEREEGFTE